MDFKVLGPLEAVAGEGPLPLGPPKQRLLLAVLLCHPNETLSTGRLIDALWGERPPPSALDNLRVYVHRLRRLLTAERIPGRGRPGYALLVRPDEVDAGRFVDLARRGRQALADGDLRRGRELLCEAEALWRGAPFADLEGEPALAEETARLEAHRVATIEQRIDADLALGRHADLIAELSALVRHHPFRERFRIQLMLALYRSGRQADALAAYRDARQDLADELGLEPGPELHRMQQAILTGDPALAAAAPPALGGGQRVAQLPPTIADFTGRGKQERQVHDVLTSDDLDALPVVLISGRAGVGKTTLAVYAAHGLRAEYPDGQLFVNLRGVHPAPLTPGEVLGQFLRALGVEGAVIPDGAEERAALYRSRLADRRVLVLLDDAHGEAQVRPLLPGTPTCAVLVTSRARLAGLETALSIDLDVLEPDMALDLFSRITGPERVAAEPATAAEIVRLCGHLPLALRVAGARLNSHPTWTLRRLAEQLGDERQRLNHLVAGDLAVRASLALSYVGLSEAERRAFRMLGLLAAPDFPTWVAAALLDIPAEAAEPLVASLIRARLLEEGGVDATGQLRYRFHDLIRVYARERDAAEDPDEQREAALARALGAWLALAEAADQALTERTAADVRGGAPRWDPGPATTRPLVADAPAWFESERAALAAGVAQACRHDLGELAWELAARTVNFYALRGLYEDWARTHEQALRACARAGNRLGAAVMARNLGCLRMTGVKVSGIGLASAESAAATFRELGEPHGEVDALTLCGFALRHRGEVEAALDVADAAMATATRIDYRLGQCRSWYLRAVINRERGRYEDAAVCAERCLDLARRFGTAHDRVLALWEVAAACRDPAALERASRALQDGIELCRLRGERLLEAYLLLALGDLHLRFIRCDARSLVEQALAVFQEYGVLFGHGIALRLLGLVEALEDRPKEAVEHLDQAVQIAGRLRNTHEQALALTALGRAHRASGDHEAAARAWAGARDLFLRLANPTEAAAVTALLSG